MAEIQQQTQRVKLGKTLAGLTPLLNKGRTVGHRDKKRLQGCGGVIIEAQVSRLKLLFENRHARKKGEGSALDAIGRAQSHLPVAVEKGAGDASTNILGERQRPIVKIQVEIGTVDGGFANAVDAPGIKPDRTNSGVERARSPRTRRVANHQLGLAPGRGRRKT